MDVFLEDKNQHDYNIYTAVSHTEEIAGFVCVGPTPLTEGTFDLYWVAVKPSLHNQGVGKQLLCHAEEIIASRRGRLVLAETSSQPKYSGTRIFYIRSGYSELARVKDYYRIDDDLVVYGKYLKLTGDT